MSAAAVHVPAVTTADRRLGSRRPLTLPVEVTLLRSGVPDRVPARMLNVAEGGLAMIVSAELRVGDLVGIEFRQGPSSSPIVVKARVRHQAFLRCGLEFLIVSDHQRQRLRNFFQQKYTPAPASLLSLAEIPQLEIDSPESPSSTEPRAPRSALRWLWLALATCLLVGGIGWWRWYQAWSDLESRMASEQARVVAPPPFSISEDTAERLLIYRIEPFYPVDARQANLSGTVTLDVIIGADGIVRDAHTISGPDLLNSSAIDAVKLWRFQPYQLNGKLIPVQTTLRVAFQANP